MEKKHRKIAYGYMVCPWGGGYQQAAFEEYMGKIVSHEFTLHKTEEDAAVELNALPHGDAKYMAIRRVEICEVL